jgi:hypothetical protein
VSLGGTDDWAERDGDSLKKHFEMTKLPLMTTGSNKMSLLPFFLQKHKTQQQHYMKGNEMRFRVS